MGGGLLQQPVYVRDLVATILSCAGNTACQGKIFQMAGPDIMESREYYRVMAVLSGHRFIEQELSQSEWLAAHPDDAVGLCHRIYDLGSLRQAGLSVPSTPFMVAMRTTLAEAGLLPTKAPAADLAAPYWRRGLPRATLPPCSLGKMWVLTRLARRPAGRRR